MKKKKRKFGNRLLTQSATTPFTMIKPKPLYDDKAFPKKNIIKRNLGKKLK